jgi:tRNA (guanine37-N1)-methyltransferase
MDRIGYDVVGNIAILKFDRGVSISLKKKFALNYLDKHKAVNTVLEKVGKFSGRLRTLKTKFLAGDKTLEALYRENGCEFRFNVETCYFSPRLSEERKNIASFVKSKERVLVMFGGVAPFAIVIAKNSKASEVYSVELGRECSKYAIENVRRNKLIGKVGR